MSHIDDELSTTGDKRKTGLNRNGEHFGERISMENMSQPAEKCSPFEPENLVNSIIWPARDLSQFGSKVAYQGVPIVKLFEPRNTEKFDGATPAPEWAFLKAADFRFGRLDSSLK